MTGRVKESWLIIPKRIQLQLLIYKGNINVIVYIYNWGK